VSAVGAPKNVPSAHHDVGVADLRHQLGLILAALAASAPNEVERVPRSAGTSEHEQHQPTLVLDGLPALISVSTAAKVLGISRASAYRYAACEDLPTVRLGGRLYIVTARLREFLEAA
jgi:hypothetical protein